ncbi:hypothetical protein [Rhizobium sp. Leaf341]|uniref:hypothetical protein n=1 Tax=Rhizobium sp. Leaf341 TaxID=1736344 RepID=UPI0007161B76|nr:hypothetical protein [Rhizobium sp. Leaf341]KQR77354.1 hypothetical protein ASG03_12930 [Rhizobium sp. Leaf341]
MIDGQADPALFGAWPKRCVYDGALAVDAEPTADKLTAGEIRLFLDRKAADMPAGDALLEMLNGMTRELREQMQMFQMLRQQADRQKMEAGEEIDRKVAQADAKASIEAMSLIVRTLEKIDSLHRTLAQDRERLDAETLDDAGYHSLLVKLEAVIEQRTVERFREREAEPAARTGKPADGAPVEEPGAAGRPAALSGDDAVPGVCHGERPLPPYG